MVDVRVVYEFVYVHGSMIGVRIIGAADTIEGMNKIVRSHEEKWGKKDDLRVQTVDGLNINSGCYATFLWGVLWGVGLVIMFYVMFAPGGAG